MLHRQIEIIQISITDTTGSSEEYQVYATQNDAGYCQGDDHRSAGTLLACFPSLRQALDSFPVAQRLTIHGINVPIHQR